MPTARVCRIVNRVPRFEIDVQLNGPREAQKQTADVLS